MARPRSGRVRYETGQGRNTSQVRKAQAVRAGKRRPRAGTIQVVEFRPPLDHPVDLGTERIWGSRATSTSGSDQHQPG